MWLVLLALLLPAAVPETVRWSFDDLPVGELDGWVVGHLPNTPFEAEVFEDDGNHVLRLRPTRPGPGGGNASIQIDGDYADRRVKISVRIRVDAGGSGNVGLLARGANREQLAVENVPVAAGDWRVVTTTLDIPAETTALVLGIGGAGGTVLADDLELSVVADAGAGDLPPMELTDDQVVRLATAGELIGLVRWFYPAANPAGDDFAIELVRLALASDDRDALAAALKRLLAASAPEAIVSVEPIDPPVPQGQLARRKHAGPSMARGPSVYDETLLPTMHADGETVVFANGVQVYVPLAQPPGHARPDAAIPVDRPDGWKPSVNDRATRLAAVLEIHAIARNFYPYPDALAADFDAVRDRALREVATATNVAEAVDALDLLVAAMNDGHARLIHRSDPRKARLPLDWRVMADDLVVTAVAGPLAGGLEVGDVVTAVDGVPAAELLAAQRVSGATPQWRDYRAAESLRMRMPGAIVTVTVEGEAHRVVAVNVAAPQPPVRASVDEVEPGVWYIDLSRVTTATLSGLWNKLAEARGVVFDMRGYPKANMALVLGHLTAGPLSSPPFDVPEITRPGFENVTWRRVGWEVPPIKPRVCGEVFWLIGGEAISAAETMTAIVAHYDLATLVGSATAGTNGNVAPVDLPGGFTLVFTGMKVSNHDESPLHGTGVLPDVEARPTAADLRAGRDVVLDKAIKLIAERTGE